MNGDNQPVGHRNEGMSDTVSKDDFRFVVQSYLDLLRKARAAMEEAREKLAADYGPADGNAEYSVFWSDQDALDVVRMIDEVVASIRSEEDEGATGDDL